MKRILSILLTLTFAGTLCACSQTSSGNSVAPAAATADSAVPSTAAKRTEQQFLEDSMKSYNLEGVAIVVKDGKTLCQAATGIADPETGEESTTDSLYCVGSVGKQFCATAVMLLQQQGKLSVDDMLGKYYPECPYGDKVSLSQMMSMRSGIAEFYDTTYDGHNLNETPVGDLAKVLTNEGTVEENREILTKWLFEQPLEFEPDAENMYCNSNFFLLASIVEKVSGESYEDFVKENIFAPLGMTNSGFVDELLDDPRLAKNSQADKAKTVYVGITRGLGDIVTCADDMKKWMLSFAEDKLLTADSKLQMMYDPDEDGYGFGISPYDGNWYHSGVFTSYLSFDYIIPSQHAGIFLVTNNQDALRGDLSTMCAELADKLVFSQS